MTLKGAEAVVRIVGTVESKQPGMDEAAEGKVEAAMKPSAMACHRDESVA